MRSWKSANPTSNASSACRDQSATSCLMRLSLRRVSGPSEHAENAHSAWPSRSGLLLELCVGGCRGFGEASPLPGLSPDTLESAATALGALDLAAVERALDLEHTEDSLDAVASLLPQGKPAARMALETAVLDMRGHLRRRSAPALLGADSGATRALAWLVGAPDAGALDRIHGAQRAGYVHFKLKLGGPGNLKTELDRVQALRTALGAAPRLRIDVNRAWSLEQTRYACRILETLDIEFLEEPSALLTKPLCSTIPLALDESLRGLDPDDLAALARSSGARVVVLKPMLLGGLSHCLTLGRRAAALNLSVIVSHSFDGPVALTAAAALALALPGRAAPGLGAHPGIAAWPQLPLPIVDGRLHAWSGTGLGFASDPLT